MSKDPVATSKFLSLVLRHKPETIGLALDANGWVNLEELVRQANECGYGLTIKDIFDAVASSDKQRFALDPSGQRIRANQGHSVKVDLALAALQPPTLLYHGTATRFLTSIRHAGLLKQARHHVHLSLDAGTAARVGSRHGQPVVLIVRAEQMSHSGHLFYRSQNGVWLTDHVPPTFIEFPL
ncbi:RNA 2'-phosphotransferase [Dyella choica]|uniref:Probable RNA 2'-phosphotransferase n=1 Tax=Dyella choica TaxID=1927959 RepID=A0A3S0RKA8_9GAMM|nr:RNA 2'-phosphotransferase [Dyella choica]RUL74966.1 RNA 2'-phosphotransferase [Dyella choica]